MSKRTIQHVTGSDEFLVVAPKRLRLSALQLSIHQRPDVKCQVLVCGQGDCGQLGLGDHFSKFERKRPTLLPGFLNVVDICAGGMHNLFLLDDGHVYSFGCNDEGALGRAGCQYEPGRVDLPGKAVKITAGDSHSACLLEDGRLYAWGTFRDSIGSMGLTTNGKELSPLNILPEKVFCDIASGADHLVMLDQEGKVYTMGVGEQGQLGRVSLRNADRGGRYGLALLLTPKEMIIPQVKNIDAIWATTYCTFIRNSKTDAIWAFGLNCYSQLGKLTTRDIVIRPFKTNFKDVKEIAGGMHHTVVLKNDGSCSVLGRPDYGRLGLGNLHEVITELTPIQSLASKNVSFISCGEAQSFAITDDGKLYSWGMGSNSQLGTGFGNDVFVPTSIHSGFAAKFKRVAGGGQHTLFLIECEPLSSSINNISDPELEFIPE